MNDSAEQYIPLLRLGHCMFVSVPGALTDSQARGLHEAVSRRLASERGVRGLALDVSAVAVVDSFVAKMLGETASIARSFGARAVLVGMQPTVAVTLVELGVDLRHVETALNLEKALERMRVRLVSLDDEKAAQ